MGNLTNTRIITGAILAGFGFCAGSKLSDLAFDGIGTALGWLSKKANQLGSDK